MNHRLTRAMTIATLGIAATGLFVPQAVAQSAPNLAPGLDCEELQCTNNSDNAYMIYFEAVCVATSEPNELRALVPDIDQISPHQRNKLLDTNCPAHYGTGKYHDKLVNGYVIDANYTGAAVVPPHRPGTGSAG